MAMMLSRTGSVYLTLLVIVFSSTSCAVGTEKILKASKVTRFALVQQHLHEKTQKTSEKHFAKLLENVQQLHNAPPLNANLISVNRQSDGFSGHQCTTDSDCSGERECIQIENNSATNCDGAAALCFCFPEKQSDVLCNCDDPECLDGDICSESSTGTSGCVANGVVGFTPLVCEEGSFTGGACTEDNDCAGDRECVDISGDQPMSCTSPSGCLCFPFRITDVTCSCSDLECLEGDICSQIGDSVGCISSEIGSFTPIDCDTDGSQPSSSPVSSPSADGDSSPSPSPSRSASRSVEPIVTQITRQTPPPPTPPPCIDARALSHLDKTQLVYEEHAISRVLCDKFGSCATPGHMIYYKGSAMMMRRYCEQVGCGEQVMEVNSPRYKRGVRIASKTDRLEYTAFAARYGTTAEEAILASAIRIGL